MGLITDIAKSSGLQCAEIEQSPNHRYTSDDIDSYLQPTGNHILDLAKSSTWKFYDQKIAGLAEIPQDGDYTAFIDTFAVIPWVYTACWIIASNIAGLPFQIFEGKGEDAKLIEEGPLYDLLVNPNEFDTFTWLMEFTVLNCELTGNGYWEAKPSIENLPLHIYGLESDHMTMDPDGKKKIKGYKYTDFTTGKKEPYDPEEIIHFKYANPANQFYGQGSVKALQMSLVTDLLREVYVKSMLENDARPDVIIRQNTDITKGVMPITADYDLRDTAKRWRESFMGSKKTRVPIVLPPGMDITLLTEQIQEMHYAQLEEKIREKVLGTIGVPPVLAGLFQYANYANSKEQLKIFWGSTLPPKIRMLSETITKRLIKLYNPNQWGKFNTSNIPALSESPEERGVRQGAEIDRGTLTRNEARIENGRGKFSKEQDPNGDADKPIILQNYIPASDVFASFDEESGEEG